MPSASVVKREASVTMQAAKTRSLRPAGSTARLGEAERHLGGQIVAHPAAEVGSCPLRLAILQHQTDEQAERQLDQQRDGDR